MDNDFDPNWPAGYAELPRSIRDNTTPEQYLWLSDAEKARLVQTDTEPENSDE
jgi:hypothetical protein